MTDAVELKEALRRRSPDENGVGCFMCRLILDDLEAHDRLTGAIIDSFEKPMFEPMAMMTHLKLENLAVKNPCRMHG